MAMAAADRQRMKPGRDQGAGVRVAKGMEYHSRQIEGKNGAAPVLGQIIGGKRRGI